MLNKYQISKEQQIKELVERVPPIVNVDIVIMKDGKYLIGHRNFSLYYHQQPEEWLFPGGRMRFEESPQETAMRILENEVPGVKAKLKKLITVFSDKGQDFRAYGVTIFYLFIYESGVPKSNSQLDDFRWVDLKEYLEIEHHYLLEIAIFKEVDAVVKTMNTTEDEILVEVDKNDKEIGTIIKREAHSSEDRIHRAAHIMLFNSKGQVVLQQRSFLKNTSPGKWDMPGGHQAYGNSIDETANQELMEEMGVKTKLTLFKKFFYKHKLQCESVYLYYGFSDGPYKFDKNEVEAVAEFDCEKLLNHEYDKDFEILSHVYGYVEEMRKVWDKK